MLFNEKNIDFNDDKYCSPGGNLDVDDSPIFDEFYIEESVKSASVPKNDKLIYFLRDLSLKDINTKVFDAIFIAILVIGCVFIFPSLFIALIRSEPFTFVELLVSSILCFTSMKIVIHYIDKYFKKRILEDIKYKLLSEVHSKSLVKNILYEYDELLHDEKIDSINKQYIQAIFNIINVMYNFKLTFNVYDWEWHRIYIRHLKEKDEKALKIGEYLLKGLRITYIEDTFSQIENYFEYIEDMEDNLIGYTYARALNIKKSIEILPASQAFLITSIYDSFSPEEIQEVIELGIDIDRFLHSKFSQEIPNQINEEIQKFNIKLSDFFDFRTKEKATS